MVGKLGSKNRSEQCCEMYRLKTQMVVLLHINAEFREILNVEFVSESDIFLAESEFFVIGVKGYCQRSTCPPAVHSVIHKMRPFQTSPHPVVAVMFIRKKMENGDEGIVFPAFWSGF